jgi:hypothetical protein
VIGWPRGLGSSASTTACTSVAGATRASREREGHPDRMTPAFARRGTISGHWNGALVALDLHIESPLFPATSEG